MVSPIGGGGSGGVNLGSAYGEIRISDNIDQALNSALGDFDNALSAIGGQMDQVGRQMSNVGQQLTIATAPLAAFGVQGVRAAADFDEALIEIQARAGLTAAELDTVRETALQLGADTVFSSQQSLDAFLQLTTSGMDMNDALATLPGVLNAAAAGGVDLGTSADLVTNVMSVFSLEAEEAESAINAMVSAAASSPADMQQIGIALQTAGGQARAFGLDVEETAASMAILRNVGLEGSEAGNAFNSMLRNLSRDVPAVQEAWNELGVSMYDADGAARDLDAVFGDLRGALEDLPVEDQNRLIQRLAGAEGRAAFNAMLHSEGIGAMTEKMREQASAAEVARARMETFTNRVNSLMGSVQTLMITTLTPFMNDVLRPMVERLTEVANAVTAWADENPELTQEIVKVLAAVTALGPVLVVLGQTLSFVGGGLAGLAPLLSVLTGPFGILAVVVGALVAHFGDFEQLMRQVNVIIGSFQANGMVEGFQRLFTTFEDGSSYLSGLLEGLGFTETASQQIANVINLQVVPALVKFGERLVGIWQTAQPQLMALVGWFTEQGLPTAINFVTGQVLPTVQRFGERLVGIWQTAQPQLTALVDWFTQTGLPTAVSFVTGSVLPVIRDLMDGLMRLWTDVSPFLAQLAGWWLTDIMPQIVNLIMNNVLPTVRDFTLLLVDIWQRAQPSLNQLYDWFVVSGLPGVMNFIEGPVTDVITVFFDLLTGAWGIVQGGVNALRDNLDRVFTSIRNNVIQPVVDLIDDLFGRFDDLQRRAEDARNAVGEELNAMQTTASQIGIIGQGVASGQIGLDDVFGFADGINLLPEDGLAMLHAGEAVIPAEYNPYNPNARQAQPVGSGGGGIQIVVENVNANNAAEGRAAGDAFADTLQNRLREMGYKN